MINTSEIKKFAREARKQMIRLVSEKLSYVTTSDSAELRAKGNQINKLKAEIAKTSENEVIERVAYTWFNRFMALRFMDANGYTNPKVVTPNGTDTFPEIFQEAKAGRFADDLHLDKDRFFGIIDRKITFHNPENEAYKMLLTAECNRWHKQMPFVFESVDDYSEILLPEDLLTGYSIIALIRDGMSDEDCQYEELIGWIYQFYISEKKDDVFADLAKNKKITPENIPAATQLFTPHWIVRYLVENSLGKLWLELAPNSKLKDQMKYFIESEITSRIEKILLTSLKFLDPCCGSGHILVYAFDLFAMMYEEEGYNQSEIPGLILKNNLFGIDIDDRAAQLTHFALTMKARRYYNGYFRNPVEPKVIAMQNFDNDLFRQAKNFGSLIRINKEQLDNISVDADTIFAEKQIEIKTQAELLAGQYHCVVTNPPYMGGNGMNLELRKYVEKYYKDSKSDLMTCFMERMVDFTLDNSYYSLINLPSWMFLSSFENLRKNLIQKNHIESLLHMGRGIFGIDFGSVAFTIKKSKSDQIGSYFRLHKRNFQHIYYYHIEQLFLRAKNNKDFRYDFSEYRDEDGVSEIPFESNPKGDKLYFTANQNSFEKIPGSPIAYWASERVIKLFENEKLNSIGISDGQNITGNNSKYLRNFWEVTQKEISIAGKWPLIAKGGEYRKWSGNVNGVINWSDEARNHYRINPIARIQDKKLWFRKGVTWNLVTSTGTGFRLLDDNSLFNKAAPTILLSESNLKYLYEIVGYLNTKIIKYILALLNPTLNTNISEVFSLPFIKQIDEQRDSRIIECIDVSRKDWCSLETSWEFHQLKISKKEFSQIGNLEDIYKAWQKVVTKDFFTLHYNEEELNRIFIDIYGLKEELTPDVELKDITILQQELKRDKLGEINDKIRHLTNEDTNLTEDDKDRIIEENSKFLTDEYFDKAEVMKQLISYSVGCMMGRYSLDKEGLILANQGETLEDYLKQVPNPTFEVDSDGIIPVLEEEFFEDDIVGRFKEFIKVAFGEEHFSENLKFIEDALGKDIRKYFVKDFYNDHIRRYKKRPIYWLFSSPKKSFNALIYMHRYTPDMVSVVLNSYMREYKAKLETKRQNEQNIKLSESSSPSDKIKAEKEITKIDAILKELKEYEETLHDAAMRRTAIDLDDGVKVNYMKFKELLYPIKGLEKEED